MFLVSLVFSSMRLGVPFIAPRQLGAIEDQHGRLSLPSIEWRTRQSSAPPDRFCRLSGARSPSFSGASDRWSSGSVGAPDTVRCTQYSLVCPNRPLLRATRRPRIARPTVALATVGSSDSPVHHRTVQCARPELMLAAHSQPFSNSNLLVLALFLALR